MHDLTTIQCESGSTHSGLAVHLNAQRLAGRDEHATILHVDKRPGLRDGVAGRSDVDDARVPDGFRAAKSAIVLSASRLL